MSSLIRRMDGDSAVKSVCVLALIHMGIWSQSAHASSFPGRDEVGHVPLVLPADVIRSDVHEPTARLGVPPEHLEEEAVPEIAIPLVPRAIALNARSARSEIEESDPGLGRQSGWRLGRRCLRRRGLGRRGLNASLAVGAGQARRGEPHRDARLPVSDRRERHETNQCTY